MDLTCLASLLDLPRLTHCLPRRTPCLKSPLISLPTSLPTSIPTSLPSSTDLCTFKTCIHDCMQIVCVFLYTHIHYTHTHYIHSSIHVLRHGHKTDLMFKIFVSNAQVVCVCGRKQGAKGVDKKRMMVRMAKAYASEDFDLSACRI